MNEKKMKRIKILVPNGTLILYLGQRASRLAAYEGVSEKNSRYATSTKGKELQTLLSSKRRAANQLV